MTLINQNSISGINSITAESNTINFYDVVGNKLNINCGVTVATGATIGGSTNTITASTNGSERVRIDSTGNVGIGTDNPASLLHLQGSAPRITFTDTAGTDDIGKIFSSSGALYLQQRDGSAHGEIIFRTENNSTAAERLRITNTGNVQIANGNLVFSTSGTGIDFSATSDASGKTSELLDDYEEGTWTPDLRFAGSNTGITYSWRNGHYTKIGRQVTVRGAFGLTSRGTFNATDDAFIYGLPFDVAPYGVTGGFHYMFGSAYNGYQGLFQLELQHSTSFSDHVPVSRQTAWNSAVSPMEYQDIGGSQRMAFIFSYFTAS